MVFDYRNQFLDLSKSVKVVSSNAQPNEALDPCFLEKHELRIQSFPSVDISCTNEAKLIVLYLHTIP